MHWIGDACWCGVIYCCVLHDFTMLKLTIDLNFFLSSRLEFLSLFYVSDDGDGDGDDDGVWGTCLSTKGMYVSVQFWSLSASRESLMRSAYTLSLASYYVARPSLHPNHHAVSHEGQSRYQYRRLAFHSSCRSWSPPGSSRFVIEGLS